MLDTEYAKSRLYAPEFSHMYRQGTDKALMKYAIITVTKNGADLACKLQNTLKLVISM